MALLDELKDMAKNAKSGAEDLFETTKLNSRINEEQRKITRSKAQLGEYIWQHYAAGQDQLPESALEICRSIDASNARIAQLTAEINNIRTQPGPGKPEPLACRSCGAELKKDQRFCPFCGSEQAPPAPPPENDGRRRCHVCGGELEEGAGFCGKCGAAQ